MRASLVEQLKTLEGKLADDAQQYARRADRGRAERLVGSTDAEMGAAAPTRRPRGTTLVECIGAIQA